MRKFLRKHISRTIKYPVKIICKREFERQTFKYINEMPLDYGFVFKCIGELQPKRILDVGTGTSSLPHLIRNCGPLVTAIDNVIDYWPQGMSNRHFHVQDRDITSQNDLMFDGKFDLITCVSVLQHIIDYNTAIRNMFSLLNIGGYLIITSPYTEFKYHENVYLLPESEVFGVNMPYVCRSYSRENINTWLKQNSGHIVSQEFWQCWSGEYWRTGERIIPPIKADYRDKHQRICILIKKAN